jgi:hypothetical protein
VLVKDPEAQAVKPGQPVPRAGPQIAVARLNETPNPALWQPILGSPARDALKRLRVGSGPGLSRHLGGQADGDQTGCCRSLEGAAEHAIALLP